MSSTLAKNGARLLAAFLAIGAICVSAEGSERACLEFQDAIALAALRDPAIAASRAERDIALADLREARSLNKPQISAFGRTGLGNVGVADSVVQNQVGLRVAQRVFDFGDAKLTLEEAMANVEAGEEDIRTRRLDAGLNISLAYIDVLDAEARLSATRQRTEYFARQLSAVDAVIDLGGATRSERAEVAAQLAQGRAFALELQFAKEGAETQLRIDTGLDLGTCSADTVETTIQRMFDEVGPIEHAIVEATSSNPAIRAIERRADGLEVAQRREARARWPVISLVSIAAYSSAGASDNFEFQDRIGIDISVPLFSGNALAARSDRATAQSAAARGEARRIRRQLEKEVSILYRRIVSMQAQLLRRGEVASELQIQFDAARIEYESGARTLPDLVEVRLEYERAAIARIAMRYDLLRRKLEMLTLTARLVGS